MENTTTITKTGYKATDKDIRCRGFQFTPGEWHEVQGDISLCGRGFHFCDQPSGPWAYYSAAGTRIWKIEAQDVLETQWEPGADRKCVARRIRLVEEVIPDGDGNTGDGNTGDRNTGDRNTGDRNTGDRNTGNGNTGYGNTGNRNTGYGNTGYGNTGYRNTGDRNTGYGNTGDRNTGDGNTGYRNTGDGNATDRSAGFFNVDPQTVTCFDSDTGMTRNQFDALYVHTANSLCCALAEDAPIDFNQFSHIPNITPEKLTALHAKHMAARAKAAR